MSDFVFHAFEFDGKGLGNRIQQDSISDRIQSERLAWVHMDAAHPDTRTWLESEIGYLDRFIVDALLADETRPRMTQIDKGILLNLRGANLNDNANTEDMVSIRLWVDQFRIISVQRRRLKAVQDIVDRIEMGKAPKCSGDFICDLVSHLFKRMSPAISALDDRTDDTEAKVLEGANVVQREEIIAIRKQAIVFRRYISPQRDAISQLRLSDLDWLSDHHKRYLQENLNEVFRLIEDLDAVRERAQIIKDELANIMTDKLNKNMYVLSVIAAIFLPLGFLTGLLGINVGGIPGTESKYAFWIVTFVLSVIVAVQVWTFKKLKWF